MAETLSREACTQAVQELKGWSVAADGKAIAKTFTFKDFTQAFAFMTRIAGVADAADHHPDWRNVYNRVEVTLSTHDAGGVTERDLSLAKAMEEAG